MNRRLAAALLAAGVTRSRLLKAQHQMQAAATGSYRPQFFPAEEFRFLDVLSEMILPHDEQSPGAHDAKVANFMDLVVANSAASVQKEWRAGIQAFGLAGFLAANDAGRREIVERAASEERAPSSEQGRFFARCKAMVIRAYYTSEIGVRRELGYTGPAALAKFPGCAG